MTSHKTRLILLAKFLISVAAIWYLVSGMDLGDMRNRLLGISSKALLLAGVLLFLQYVLCAFRWRQVLAAMGALLPWLTLLRVFVIGAFFNHTLPSSVGGDAVRVVMTRHAGLRWGAAFNGVMLERVAIVAAIPLVVLVVQPWFLPKLNGTMGTWMLAGIAVLTVGAIAGIGVLTLLEHLPSSIRRWRVVAGIAALGGDARRVFLDWRNGPAIFAWSMAGHVNIAIIVFVLGRGMDLDVTVVDCVVLVPLVLLATTIPLSIGGWGIREGAMVFGFGLVGVPEAGAFSLSVLTGLLSIVVSLPGGVAWLVTRDRRTVAETAEADMPVKTRPEVALGGQ